MKKMKKNAVVLTYNLPIYYTLYIYSECSLINDLLFFFLVFHRK